MCSHRATMSSSSVFNRDGAILRESAEFGREPLEAGGLGVAGNGFTVMLERALSVLELVAELTRAPTRASFLVIVTLHGVFFRDVEARGLPNGAEGHTATRGYGRQFAKPHGCSRASLIHVGLGRTEA